MAKAIGISLAAIVLFVLVQQLDVLQLITATEPEPEPGEATIEALDVGPDVFATAVEFNQLHPDGALHYRLKADTIRQYNEDQLTRMAQPRIHLTNPEQPPWDIVAMRGYMRKQRNQQGVPEDVVFLSESVEMVQLHPTNGPVTLRGESFYIYPARQYAESAQNVMIDTEVGRTHAGAMQADFDSGLLKLSSNSEQRVHTIVLPEQFKKS